jgi:hypothetical protein
MNKRFVAVALAFAACSNVGAVESASTFHPLLGVGLTFGGTTLANVQYVNGGSCSLHAGGLADIYAGVDYRRGERVSLEATAGYHVDGCNGDNGSLQFSRYPLELLAYYGLGQHWRAGGGVRFVLDPHISGSGVAGGANVKFRSATGGVIEGEYLLSRTSWAQVGFKVRYVFERYRPEAGGSTLNGNHVGILTSAYF